MTSLNFVYILLILCSEIILVQGTKPKAPHMVHAVDSNSEVVIKLTGYDKDGDNLEATVTSLPTVGKLYQLSQVYNDHGYEPKYDSTTEIKTPNTKITGKWNRLVYVPPENKPEPHKGPWTYFKYVVHDGTSSSAEGRVTVTNKDLTLVASDFSMGTDGWKVVNNGLNGVGITHERTSFGELNHFIYSTEDEIDVDEFHPDDKAKWYFDAPFQFRGFHANAYGGKLEFTIGAFSGDLKNGKNKHSVRDIVVLECSTCNMRKGMRFVIRNIAFDGTPETKRIPLTETGGWLKDPKNTLKEWQIPSQCEMIEMLSSISSFRILGDHGRWYESVGIDNIKFIANGEGFKKGPPVKCLCENPGTQC